jgi:hypothetical protein
MRIAVLVTAALIVAGSSGSVAQEYEGVGVCRKCHIDQAEAWAKTPHAKAFDSLRPKMKASEKIKAKLDPERDYTKEPECMSCHTTGYGKPGGYRPDMPAADARLFVNVGCESCHGAGSKFRREHGAAEDELKSKGESTSREVLVKALQNFDYEAACASCHLNYQGSSLKDAKMPFTPFTPQVDPKYGFNFQRDVFRSGPGAGVHEHYKLKGVFKGDPVPAIREEIQKNAREAE